VTTIALTGGGTAGHITPLRAVGEALLSAHPGASLVVVGTEAGREKELLPEGFGDVIEVPKLPFPRSLSIDALRFPGRFARAVSRLRREFRERSVDVVAGFGGYIAAPAYVAAWREKIPLVIHEANALPGLANRLGARLTSHVATCFPGTALRHQVTIGMPLPRHIVDMDREALAPEGYRVFGLDPDRPVVLITGGSSGAKKLNEALVAAVPSFVDRGWQVLHLVGPSLDIPSAMPDGYVALDYCRRMELAYAVADVAISRAGAATVSELAIAGVPSILVPYHVGNGEQHRNARYLADEGAAVVVNQVDVTSAYIDAVVLPLLDDDQRRQQMGQAAKRVALTDAAEKFADMVWAAGKPAQSC
jgi:UDP-N-acetylglucosamine--N-acetylmuramyl-(pentapeptide) pyrophosphoryl-undecaprenol N-acetylglucosamine transferase